MALKHGIELGGVSLALDVGVDLGAISLASDVDAKLGGESSVSDVDLDVESDQASAHAPPKKNSGEDSCSWEEQLADATQHDGTLFEVPLLFLELPEPGHLTHTEICWFKES